jgi:hypothetical protein
MKRRRLVIGLVLLLAVVALVLYGRSKSPQGFTTPGDCLDAYRDASKDGDVARYLSCLGEPLRSAKQQSVSAADLIREMDGVKGWSRHEPVIRDRTADVEVDLVRKTGIFRLGFRLQRAEYGWLIVALDGPHERPSQVPYGTPVGEGPE